MKNVIALFYFLSIFFLSQHAFSLEASPFSLDQKIILNDVNQYRLKQGLAPLRLNVFISNEATKHSRAMAEKNTPFGHHGFKSRAYSIFSKLKHSHAIAENVAYIDGNIKNITKLWLSSRGHRKNIEGRYHLTGIGVAYDKNGRAFVTQIFLSV